MPTWNATRRLLFSASVAGMLALGCGPSIPRARLSAAEPPTPREIESAEVYRSAPCAAKTGLWFPGLGQLCQRRVAEGTVLTALGAAEIASAVGAGVASNDVGHPGVVLSLVGLQNVWVGGYGDALFVEQRAHRLRYVPPDTLAELAVAPFNGYVLSKPEVWLGLVGQLGAALALQAALGTSFDTDNVGDDANLFGRRYSPSVGYPLAGFTGAALFTHVAVGEEILFRGMIQSEMARRNGEVEALIGQSLVFGALHAPNALALPPADQKEYLLYGVPFLTLSGAYLGFVYRHNDYSLAPSVALHFWYNLLLSATQFVLDPDDSILAARVTVPF